MEAAAAIEGAVAKATAARVTAKAGSVGLVGRLDIEFA
jgi:hypothetical protein